MQPPWLFIAKTPLGYNPGTDGYLRFLDCPLDARCPLPPRRTGQLHMPVPSLSVQASP